jgi:hypothetical protein
LVFDVLRLWQVLFFFSNFSTVLLLQPYMLQVVVDRLMAFLRSSACRGDQMLH